MMLLLSLKDVNKLEEEKTKREPTLQLVDSLEGTTAI
jgi:hypothetical protein